MKREEFSAFVEHTLEDVVRVAEEKCGKKLSRKLAFKWWTNPNPPVTDNIVEYIVQKLWVDEDHIYPCVDIGVGDIQDDGTLVIIANVAGYKPQPFGKNRTGRDGPFIWIFGQEFLDKISGRKDKGA